MNLARKDVHIYLIRHGSAKDRSHWGEDDKIRPLTARGVRQAESIAEQLKGAQIASVLSSPFLRCVETVSPLAEVFDLQVQRAEFLSEGEDPKRAMAELMKAAIGASPRAVVACSHGDVIPAILDLLIKQGADFSGTRTVRKGASFELSGTEERISAVFGVDAPSFR